ncbi:hypothetical protein ACVWZ6_006266 [Bradyrhizobium sp. GM6.1]
MAKGIAHTAGHFGQIGCICGRETGGRRRGVVLELEFEHRQRDRRGCAERGHDLAGHEDLGTLP